MTFQLVCDESMLAAEAVCGLSGHNKQTKGKASSKCPKYTETDLNR